MTREEHLSYCKICLNRKMDMKKGLVCNLTNEIADFQETCENFKEDPIKKKELESIPSIQEVDNTVKLNNGSQWFLWIFGLSEFFVDFKMAIPSKLFYFQLSNISIIFIY